jgi:transcriptional regulator of acetoin/glycerol metabolism
MNTADSSAALPGSTLAGITEQAIRAAIEASGGNVAAAARRLGVSRSTLYRHMR